MIDPNHEKAIRMVEPASYRSNVYVVRLGDGSLYRDFSEEYWPTEPTTYESWFDAYETAREILGEED